MEIPQVSILTPVYDRKKFLPLMISNMSIITYPRDKLEWVILDSWSKDGKISEPLFTSQEEIVEYSNRIGIEIRYIYKPEALSIGKKRNMLVKEANYKYCINMDSDDIYLPDYIYYSIGKLKTNKKDCCGSPQMLFLYPNDNYKVTAISCSSLRQIHEATMAHTKKHHKRMGGYATSSAGEGAKMVDGCNESFFIKTEIEKCMICVCHDNNTVDKNGFNREDITLQDVKIELIPQMKVLKDIFS
tara:strand:+ start:300 stop:1031 length:732 start_codon:yes stop_codon:yes gene_type:complete